MYGSVFGHKARIQKFKDDTNCRWFLRKAALCLNPTVDVSIREMGGFTSTHILDNVLLKFIRFSSMTVKLS